MVRRLIFNVQMRMLVINLVDQGVRIPDIAERVGITEQSLRCLCSKHGISLRKNRKVISANVSPDCYLSLVTEADRMQTTVPKMVVSILEVVVKDRLIDALDIKTMEEKV